MRIGLDTLRERLEGLLVPAFGGEAKRIIDVLVWTEMAGIVTQGLIKLTGTEPMQRIAPDGAIRTERDTAVSRQIDAAHNPAMLATQIATDVAIEKASASGVGVVGVRGIFSSNGAQAYYADRIARLGLLALVMSRSPASVAPFNSIDPLFGTNPIGAGFPVSEGDPLVFDLATSALTWYGLVLAKARGDVIPFGVAIDADGNPTTDPSVAMSGALLPFDRGAKGSSLGLLVELMAGPLVGAGAVDVALDQQWGSIVIALDPDILAGRDAFARGVTAAIAEMRKVRTRGESLRLPGQRMYAALREASARGWLEIDDAIARELGWADATAPR